jgi:putative transposase
MLKINPSLLRKFKGYCFSPEIIMLFVYMKARFSLSYRELEEMGVMRGIEVDHATIQRWVRGIVKLFEEGRFFEGKALILGAKVL